LQIRAKSKLQHQIPKNIDESTFELELGIYLLDFFTSFCSITLYQAKEHVWNKFVFYTRS